MVRILSPKYISIALQCLIAMVYGVLLGLMCARLRVFKRGIPNVTRRISFQLTVELLGKLVRADGVVTVEENRYLDGYISSIVGEDVEAKAEVLAIARSVAFSSRSVKQIAEEFYELHDGSRSMCEHLVDILTAVAASDRAIDPSEESLLREIVFALHLKIDDLNSAFSRNHVQRNSEDKSRSERKVKEDSDRSRHSSSPPRSPPVIHLPRNVSEAYVILGCQSTDSMGEVKKRYRQLAIKFHPDRLRNDGLSDEEMSFATTRFSAINSAFELIERHRKKAHP